MFSIYINITFLFLLNVFVHIQTLVELPSVEDNDIANVERVIRNTVNNLFVTFKPRDMSNNPKFKQLSTIHNFFVSITLKDCKNLKEIARLTRVNNIDNNTQSFITQLNEVLDEDDKTTDILDNNIFVSEYAKTVINKLKYLKEKYVYNKETNINSDNLTCINSQEQLSNDNNTSEYVLKKTDENDDINEYWTPMARRVFEGISASVITFPFMASIRIFEQYHCGGSIIHKDLVITSASCLQIAWNNRFLRQNPVFISVQVGRDYNDYGGDRLFVKQINFHPDYEPKTLQNNLAILKLKKDMDFKTPKVKKISIDNKPTLREEVTIIGWGAVDNSNYVPRKSKLAFANLQYYPLEDCKRKYTEDYVTNKNFCVGDRLRGSGACNRDAGAPGTVEGSLVGIISFGSPTCGAIDSPTVFTKLSYYRSWIYSFMTPSGKPTIWPTRTTNKDKLRELQTTPLVIKTEFNKDNYEKFLATLFTSTELRDYFHKIRGDIRTNKPTTTTTPKPKRTTKSRIIKRKKTTRKTSRTTRTTTTAQTKTTKEKIKNKGDKISNEKNKDDSESYRDSTEFDDYSSMQEHDDKPIKKQKTTKTTKKTETKAKKKKPEVITTTTTTTTKTTTTTREATTIAVTTTTKPTTTRYVYPNFVVADPSSYENDDDDTEKPQASLSKENQKNMSIQQSLLNYLVSGEVLDDQVKPFKDLTFRDSHNNKTIKKVLTANSLYKLIALAVDEEKSKYI